MVMNSVTRLVGVIWCGFWCGCNGDVVDDDATTTTTSVGTSGGGQEYLLDFTSSESGGVEFGGNTNLAFALSGEVSREYDFEQNGEPVQEKPGVVVSNDFTR